MTASFIPVYSVDAKAHRHAIAELTSKHSKLAEATTYRGEPRQEQDSDDDSIAELHRSERPDQPEGVGYVLDSIMGKSRQRCMSSASFLSGMIPSMWLLAKLVISRKWSREPAITRRGRPRPSFRSRIACRRSRTSPSLKCCWRISESLW
eukprot:s3146_g4.t1